MKKTIILSVISVFVFLSFLANIYAQERPVPTVDYRPYSQEEKPTQNEVEKEIIPITLDAQQIKNTTKERNKNMNMYEIKAEIEKEREELKKKIQESKTKISDLKQSAKAQPAPGVDQEREEIRWKNRENLLNSFERILLASERYNERVLNYAERAKSLEINMGMVEDGIERSDENLIKAREVVEKIAAMLANRPAEYSEEEKRELMALRDEFKNYIKKSNEELREVIKKAREEIRTNVEKIRNEIRSTTNN